MEHLSKEISENQRIVEERLQGCDDILLRPIMLGKDRETACGRGGRRGVRHERASGLARRGSPSPVASDRSLAYEGGKEKGES